jgi:hypothetical protein
MQLVFWLYRCNDQRCNSPQKKRTLGKRLHLLNVVASRIIAITEDWFLFDQTLHATRTSKLYANSACGCSNQDTGLGI